MPADKMLWLLWNSKVSVIGPTGSMIHIFKQFLPFVLLPAVLTALQYWKKFQTVCTLPSYSGWIPNTSDDFSRAQGQFSVPRAHRHQWTTIPFPSNSDLKPSHNSQLWISIPNRDLYGVSIGLSHGTNIWEVPRVPILEPSTVRSRFSCRLRNQQRKTFSLCSIETLGSVWWHWLSGSSWLLWKICFSIGNLA